MIHTLDKQTKFKLHFFSTINIPNIQHKHRNLSNRVRSVQPKIVLTNAAAPAPAFRTFFVEHNILKGIQFSTNDQYDEVHHCAESSPAWSGMWPSNYVVHFTVWIRNLEGECIYNTYPLNLHHRMCSTIEAKFFGGQFTKCFLVQHTKHKDTTLPNICIPPITNCRRFIELQNINKM